jgi:hypothetical protein
VVTEIRMVTWGRRVTKMRALVKNRRVTKMRVVTRTRLVAKKGKWMQVLRVVGGRILTLLSNFKFLHRFERLEPISVNG